MAILFAWPGDVKDRPLDPPEPPRRPAPPRCRYCGADDGCLCACPACGAWRGTTDGCSFCADEIRRRSA